MNWSSIKWKIHSWFWYDSWIYINTLTIKKCYREWREVSKYVEKPHWKYDGNLYPWRGKFSIFRLEILPMEWKTKYGEYRYEENPTINLSIFGWNWRWSLVPDRDPNGENVDLQYWETVLWLSDYLKKYSNPAEAVYRAIKDNTWGRTYDKDSQPINVYHMLTQMGKHLYDTWDQHKKNEVKV